MNTAAEDIVTEIVGLLQAPPMTSVAAAGVYRDLMQALQAEELPAVAIELGDEDSPERVLLGTKHRRVEVRVTVLAKGDTPYREADAALLETHNRIFASQSVDGEWLNGLAMDIVEGPTRRARNGYSEDLASVTKTYAVTYRTAEHSLARWQP